MAKREAESRVRAPQLVCVGLILLTLILFWPATTHDFVRYDDPLYVTSNSHVTSGLTAENLKWDFVHLVGNRTYWHPVTWLSHQLDCQLFGLKAGSHHLVNLFFHLLNVMLLFFLLHRLTGALWSSATVAALFAWHPLQVDTVAWIAERKNLLGTLFGLAAMWTYVGYAGSKITSPEPGKPFRARRPAVDYFFTLAFFALGLMSKSPLLVTLPCVFLLLDFWPLGRVTSNGAQIIESDTIHVSRITFHVSRFVRLAVEKIPFFALSAVSSVITFLAHQQLNLVFSGEKISLGERIINGFVAYIRYLRKIFWPNDLAVYYPLQSTPLWLQWTAPILVFGVSILAFLCARRRPWLFVGWFWFVGTLVPFAGFVQAGVQSIADRFVYFPLIGFWLMLVFGIAELAKRRFAKGIFTTLAAVMLIGCVVATRTQLSHWKNTITLFTHAVAVTKYNVVAHVNLGSALQEEGRLDEAAREYAAALDINSNSREAHYFLAKVLEKQGDLHGAAEHYNDVLRIEPDYAPAANDLGVLLMKAGHLQEAAVALNHAVRASGDFAEAYYNLGLLSTQQHRAEEAIGHYEQAIRRKPDYAEAHNNLATVLAEKGDFENAARHLFKTVELQPNDAEAQFNLSFVLGKLGRTNEAQEHLALALKLKPDLLKK